MGLIKNLKESNGEQKLREAIRKMVIEDFAGAYPEHQRKKFDGKRRKQSEVLGYKLTGESDVKAEIDDATVKEGNIGITTKKGKSIELTHKTSGKEIVVVNTPSVLKKYAKMGYLISMPEGKLNEAKFKDIDVKKLGKKKTNDLMKYLFNIVDLGLKTDMKTDTKKKILSVNISKISPKVAQNIQKRFGVDLTEQKITEVELREIRRRML